MASPLHAAVMASIIHKGLDHGDDQDRPWLTIQILGKACVSAVAWPDRELMGKEVHSERRQQTDNSRGGTCKSSAIG
jgi:hypothetical protein